MVWCGKLMGNDDVNTKQQFNETNQNRIEQEPILSAAMHSFTVPYENTLFIFCSGMPMDCAAFESSNLS